MIKISQSYILEHTQIHLDNNYTVIPLSYKDYRKMFCNFCIQNFPIGFREKYYNEKKNRTRETAFLFTAFLDTERKSLVCEVTPNCKPKPRIKGK